MVRLIPLILFQAGEIGEALRARGIERCKNPLTRTVRFAVPLFRRVFLKADELTETMQARCYNENRTDAALAFSGIDGWAAAIGVLLCLTAPLP
jgi:biotin transport system permease protein/energy-coupling factor transport system permease protein